MMGNKTTKTVRKQNKISSADILDALDNYFPMSGKYTYVRFRELEVEIGGVDDDIIHQREEFFIRLGKDSYTRIDYWVMALNNLLKPRPIRPATAISIEVKVDRRDFMKELKKPQKQRYALMYSNLFYYCAPKDLIKPNELPPYAGLLEYNNGVVSETISAPRRDAILPRWTFVASLLQFALALPKKD